MAICTVLHGIVLNTQFHFCHIFQTKYAAVWKRLDDHVLIVLLHFVTTSVLQNVLERIVCIGTQSTSWCFNVLLCQYIVYIRRHKTIGSHFERIEPYAHTITRTPDIHLSNTSHTRESWLNVNHHVVRQEVRIIGIRRTIKREALDVTGLAFAHRHTASCYVGRQLSLSRGNTVLYVYHCHIGIRALLEKDADASRTRVGGRRSHIHHVLHAIQALLQRNNNTLLYRFCIGTGIVGTNADRWGGYLRKLFYG